MNNDNNDNPIAERLGSRPAPTRSSLSIQPPHHMAQRFWRDWRGFVLFVAIMLMFRSAIADWNQVPSGSMKPTILVGDRIVVDKLAYDLRVPFTFTRLMRWGEPARGDVVTFSSPKDGRLFVKRIIGVPGDQVELRNNSLTINGVEATYTPLHASDVPQLSPESQRRHRFLREDILGMSQTVMLAEAPPRPYKSFGPIEVPAEHLLVLGDNRDDSGDFREIGFVARERIFGRAHTIAFSLDYDHYYAPRANRFFEKLP